MNFHWDVSFGQVLQAGSWIVGIFVLVWKARGWLDGMNDGMKSRHRQNTQRLDFLLDMVNDDREARGLQRRPCPYRTIIDS